jgi:hypothetical protein
MAELMAAAHKLVEAFDDGMQNTSTENPTAADKLVNQAFGSMMPMQDQHAVFHGRTELAGTEEKVI